MMSEILGDLTPTEHLVLDVLSARRRLGENLWTFPAQLTPTLRRLESKGYIGWKGGIVEHTCLAWFNPAKGSPAEPWTREVIAYRPIQPNDDDILGTLNRDYGMPFDSHVADRLRYMLALPTRPTGDPDANG